MTTQNSLTPPPRNWWSLPIGRDEVLWISVAVAWCLVMTFMMVYWYFAGNQNQAGEAYRISPDAFAAKADEMVENYTIRTETELEVPVVAVPPGGDIYIASSQFEWNVIPELKMARLTASICHHWMSSTDFHCSRSMSISSLSPAMIMFSTSHQMPSVNTILSVTNIAVSATMRWLADSTLSNRGRSK